MRTTLALVGSVALVLALAGCSGNEETSRDVVWRLDRQATVQNADPETREWVKKHIEGLDVVLRLHGKEFDLGITGGERAEKSSGTYSTGYDNKRLHKKMLNGAPVPAGMDADLVVKADLKHIYVPVGEMTTVLSAK
jgi:hypothetical protein